METITTGQAVFSPAVGLTPEEAAITAAYFGPVLGMAQYRYKSNDFYGDPVSNVAYPVFDSFDTLNREVTGLIVATMYWRLYFMNILPPTAKGILCVLENTSFNQTFSYRIDGDTAVYVGKGDHHDPKYDGMGKTGDMATTLKDITSPETQAFTAVDVNTDFGNYVIHIYPSEETEKVYKNNDPLVYTLVIVCTFLFTSAVFISYDFLLARRQCIVMKRALASGAIVSSLFPQKVREQMYQEQTQDKEQQNTKNDFKTSSIMNPYNASTRKNESRPMAELYADTTIFFAGKYRL